MALWNKAVTSSALCGAFVEPLTLRSKEEWTKLFIAALKFPDRQTSASLVKMFHGFMGYDADMLSLDNVHLQAVLNLEG